MLPGPFPGQMIERFTCQVIDRGDGFGALHREWKGITRGVVEKAAAKAERGHTRRVPGQECVNVAAKHYRERAPLLADDFRDLPAPLPGILQAKLAKRWRVDARRIAIIGVLDEHGVVVNGKV